MKFVDWKEHKLAEWLRSKDPNWTHEKNPNRPDDVTHFYGKGRLIAVVVYDNIKMTTQVYIED